jgi:Uma2 family endonuclease
MDRRLRGAIREGIGTRNERFVNFDWASVRRLAGAPRHPPTAACYAGRVTSSAGRAATYADLVALPEGVLGQIIDGELHALPRPSLRHTRAASTLAGQLDSSFDRGLDGPGGWVFLFEPELHLGNDVVVPDVAGWRRERLPEIPDAPWLELAPDWACEVLSPSSVAIDRVRKLRLYARERVGWYWIIEPIAHTLEVYRLGDDGAYVVDATFDGAEPIRARPFEAISLTLDRL